MGLRWERWKGRKKNLKKKERKIGPAVISSVTSARHHLWLGVARTCDDLPKPGIPFFSFFLSFFSFNPQYPQQPLWFWAWSTNPKNSLASLKHPENSQIHNNQFVAPIVDFFLWVWDEKGEKKGGKKRKRKRENPETEWKGMGKKNATKPRNLMWKGKKQKNKKKKKKKKTSVKGKLTEPSEQKKKGSKVAVVAPTVVPSVCV